MTPLRIGSRKRTFKLNLQLIGHISNFMEFISSETENLLHIQIHIHICKGREQKIMIIYAYFLKKEILRSLCTYLFYLFIYMYLSFILFYFIYIFT